MVLKCMVGSAGGSSPPGQTLQYLVPSDDDVATARIVHDSRKGTFEFFTDNTEAQGDVVALANISKRVTLALFATPSHQI